MGNIYCLQYSFCHISVKSENAYLLQMMLPLWVDYPIFFFFFHFACLCIIIIDHLGEANNTDATVFPSSENMMMSLYQQHHHHYQVITDYLLTCHQS